MRLEQLDPRRMTLPYCCHNVAANLELWIPVSQIVEQDELLMVS